MACNKAYISGNGLVVLEGANKLLQTIYEDEVEDLDAVALDEASGKIATCSGSTIYVYRPYGKDEGALRVKYPESGCSAGEC